MPYLFIHDQHLYMSHALNCRQINLLLFALAASTTAYCDERGLSRLNGCQLYRHYIYLHACMCLDSSAGYVVLVCVQLLIAI